MTSPQPDMPELESQNEGPADAEQLRAAIPVELPIAAVQAELPVPAVPVELPIAAVPVEQPMPDAPANQPGAEDVMLDEQEELSSMSESSVGGESPVGGRTADGTPAEASGSSTSSEDYLPLAHFIVGSDNGPKNSMMYVPGRYPPGVRPAEPVARQYGGRGLPANRSLIRPPSRRRPPSNYDSSYASSTSSASNSSPPRPKRGRSDRQY